MIFIIIYKLTEYREISSSIAQCTYIHILLVVFRKLLQKFIFDSIRIDRKRNIPLLHFTVIVYIFYLMIFIIIHKLIEYREISSSIAQCMYIYTSSGFSQKLLQKFVFDSIRIGNAITRYCIFISRLRYPSSLLFRLSFSQIVQY